MLSITGTLLTTCYEHWSCHLIRKEVSFLIDCWRAYLLTQRDSSSMNVWSWSCSSLNSSPALSLSEGPCLPLQTHLSLTPSSQGSTCGLIVPRIHGACSLISGFPLIVCLARMSFSPFPELTANHRSKFCLPLPSRTPSTTPPTTPSTSPIALVTARCNYILHTPQRVP